MHPAAPMDEKYLFQKKHVTQIRVSGKSRALVLCTIINLLHVPKTYKFSLSKKNTLPGLKQRVRHDPINKSM